MRSSLLTSYSPRSWFMTSSESRGLVVPHSELVRQLQTNEQGVVLRNIVCARFGEGERARDDVVFGRNGYDSDPGHQSRAWNGLRCSVEVHFPNRGVSLCGVYFSR